MSRKKRTNIFGGFLPRNKPFVCYGGHVTSANDGDMHYVSAMQIAKLYGVPIADCVLLNENSPLSGVYDKGRVILTPRYDGDYNLTARVREQQERVRDEFSSSGETPPIDKPVKKKD